eukprot:4334523-Lingulodinium_polyedra.AAC.1
MALRPCSAQPCGASSAKPTVGWRGFGRRGHRGARGAPWCGWGWWPRPCCCRTAWPTCRPLGLAE